MRKDLLDIWKQSAEVAEASSFVPAEANRYVVKYSNSNRSSVFFALANNGEIAFVPDPQFVYRGGLLPADAPVKLLSELEAEEYAAKNPVYIHGNWHYRAKVMTLASYFADVQMHYREKSDLLELCSEKANIEKPTTKKTKKK